MGVFDYVTCRYELPPEFPRDLEWQSKSTPAQYLDHYEIREDGSLWHETYVHRVETQSDGYFNVQMYRDNPEWKREDFTGELEIHSSDDRHWYTVQFWFRDGVVKDFVANATPLHKKECVT
jgi:hypothetical protein